MSELLYLKDFLNEKKSIEYHEAELWNELHDPYIHICSIKNLNQKIKDYRKIYELAITYNNDDIQKYEPKKHDAEHIVKYVNEYTLKNAIPEDGNMYTCLYICRDIGESGCINISLKDILIYQNYLKILKKRFTDFDVDKEHPWLMWISIRNDAYQKLSNILKNLAANNYQHIDSSYYENFLLEYLNKKDSIFWSALQDNDEYIITNTRNKFFFKVLEYKNDVVTRVGFQRKLKSYVFKLNSSNVFEKEMIFEIKM